MKQSKLPPRRRAMRIACAALALLPVLPARALAQGEYPTKPIRLVVPYPAGGLTDTLARQVAEGLSKRLGQTVVVENKGGAGGIIGTDFVAKSAPDGYTLLMTIPGPITANIALYKKLPYDPRTELRPISDIATARTVLTVNSTVPVKTVAELLAYAKKEPGKLRMGSWGPGTQPHTIQAYMDKTYGVDILHVPYRGEGPMVSDLLAGQVNLTIGSVTTLRQHIAMGKLRPLGSGRHHACQGAARCAHLRRSRLQRRRIQDRRSFHAAGTGQDAGRHRRKNRPRSGCAGEIAGHAGEDRGNGRRADRQHAAGSRTGVQGIFARGAQADRRYWRDARLTAARSLRSGRHAAKP
jgi:tripartite-type tricarboxylate transporter receptor subunit TctC